MNNPIFLLAAVFFMVLFISAGVIASSEETTSSLVEELISAIGSKNATHKEKWDAVLKLSKYGQDATKPLLAFMITADDKGRYYAIRALGNIGDSAATEALCSSLLDRKFKQRRYAAIALGSIADPKAVMTLKSALNDVSYVRADSLDALVKIDNSESRNVLEEYYFLQADSDLKLIINADRKSYALNDRIRIEATLINQFTKAIHLIITPKSSLGELVFQRHDGAFIEKVKTGRDHDKFHSRDTVKELGPGEMLRFSFSGEVGHWTRGEKDDHAFNPSTMPFLTLDFIGLAYHLRSPGKYKVRVVFKQDDECIEIFEDMKTNQKPSNGFWKGKVVSNIVEFTIDQ